MNANQFIRPAASALLLIATAGFVHADEAKKLPPASMKAGVTYETDIRPMIENTCFKCHGEEKQKAGLRVDSAEAVLKGAKNTKVVIVGDSANSELVKSVAHTGDDEDHWMPPEGQGDRLTPEQVGLIRAWIDQGAK